MLDLWLFSIDAGHRSIRSAIAGEILLSPSPSIDADASGAGGALPTPTTTRVVFAGEKKRGGLRILDNRLVHDVAIAPVSPPHVHTDYASSTATRGQTAAPNIAVSIALCAATRELWVGWSSGHLSVLDTSRAPIVGDGMLSAEHYRKDELPRFVDWDDLLYAHRGSVHLLAVTHESRFVVSASYDMNIIIWEASTRRQLRSLTAAAKQSLTSLHLSGAGAAPGSSFTGVCRAICEIPLDAPDGATNTLPPIGLLVLLDGGAQVVFHGVEGLLQKHLPDEVMHNSASSRPSRHDAALEVAAFHSTFVASAAASSFNSDVGVGVLCRGDESSKLHFSATLWGSGGDGGHHSRGANESRLWSSTPTPSRRLQNSNISSVVLRENMFSIMDEVSSTISLGPGKQIGKVVLVVPTGIVPATVPAAASIDDNNSDAPGDRVYVCGFLVTTANRYVALVQCTVSVTRPGIIIVAAAVNALQAVPSPMTWLTPSCVTASDFELGHTPGLQMHYGIAADGTLSAVLAFRPQGTALSHCGGAPGTATRSVKASVRTHGDFLREQERLKNVVELVQSAKNSTLLADAMLQEGIQKQAELSDDNKRLRARIEELEESLHFVRDNGMGLEGKLEHAESTAESTRAKLAHANAEIKRLNDLLAVAASDHRKATLALSNASERETLNALKVQECLVQLEEQKELVEHGEKALFVSNSCVSKLTNRSDVLAAKVVELERLLANHEDVEQRHVVDAHATNQKQHRLLDEQQEIILELKERYHTTMRDLTGYKQNAERLQDEVTYWKSAYEAALHAKATSALATSSNVTTYAYHERGSGGHLGRSHSPLAAGRVTGGADGPTVLSLGRAALIKPTSAAIQRPEALSSSRLSSNSDYRRTSSPPQSRDGSAAVDAGHTKLHETNIGDEYLKTLAPPVRSASLQSAAIAVGLDGFSRDASSAASPTDLRHVSGGHTHHRGVSFGNRSGSDASAAGGPVRSVTVALSS